MSIINFFNSGIKRFTIFDVKLAQAAAIFFVLIIVQLYPAILDINTVWFVALTVLCAIRPCYLIFFKPGN